jgi:glycosyltransferase involved in cell wall biosynthesis
VKSTWSLKASARAQSALKRLTRTHRLNALFFHTQTTALFSLQYMRRIPAIVSLDATPLNYDTVAEGYGDGADNGGWLARRKYEWNRATFREAAHLITWCHWAKKSLVCDYGIAEDRISVIPPGVDIEVWSGLAANRDHVAGAKTRLLFVGGDFARKGGHILVEAFRKGLQDRCELDIVTRDDEAQSAVSGMSGARIHTGMTPNCAELQDLYRRADLFVFPTLADCLPIAVMEAMAAGLPVVATGVGALAEEVQHGVTGLIVAPKDAAAIVDAVRDLDADDGKRQSMSIAGRAAANAKFNAEKNYDALLNAMIRIAA